MKRIFLLIVSLILSGCTNRIQYYTKSFPDYLDTITTYITYASSKDDFDKQCQYIEKRLDYYDKLFDNYHTYPSITNVMTINQNAGKKAVVVDRDLFELLKVSKERYQSLSSQVNIAYGSVLTLWHDAREKAGKHKNIGEPPHLETLEEA
ncbi:MAG TPA: FAD:protein FMN transferase, partial [Erysipelotrichaceae bacterium]|nr:FAD:protein FMN transferase [Erysipelotrichaceae bacterium]